MRQLAIVHFFSKQPGSTHLFYVRYFSSQRDKESSMSNKGLHLLHEIGKPREKVIHGKKFENSTYSVILPVITYKKI